MRTIQMKATQFSRLMIDMGCLCILGCLLTACGSGSEPAGNSTAGTPAAPAVKPAGTAADAKNPLASMVKAVATDTKEQPFELRFEVATRPAMGEPFDVKLNLLSLADATGLELKLEGHPNMEIITGAQASFASLKTGASATHTVRLRSSGAGIVVADVQLTATVGGTPRTVNYAIPVAIAAAQPATAGTVGKSAVGG